MTAALCSPPGQPRRARQPLVRRPHPPAAAYRRRRAVVGLLLAGVVCSAALVADNVLTGPRGAPATAAGAGTAQPGRAVRARAGDSLWSIAARFRGDIPIGQYVEALISANGGTRVEVGQIVRLP